MRKARRSRRIRRNAKKISKIRRNTKRNGRHEHSIFKWYVKDINRDFYRTIFVCAKCGYAEWYLDYGTNSEKKIFRVSRPELSRLIRERRLVKIWHDTNLRFSDGLRTGLRR